LHRRRPTVADWLKAQSQWLTAVLSAVPVAVASYCDTKWVIAAGFAVALPLLT